MLEGESLQGGKLQGSGSGGGGKRQQWKGEGALVINRDQGTTDQGTSFLCCWHSLMFNLLGSRFPRDSSLEIN